MGFTRKFTRVFTQGFTRGFTRGFTMGFTRRFTMGFTQGFTRGFTRGFTTGGTMDKVEEDRTNLSLFPIEKKSTHKVEVVPVMLEPHPNADSLSIVHVFGYTVLVRTEDWKNTKLGAYIVPDSVVDTTRSEFKFLEGHPRIKVKRLRGVLSQGLLVPAPPGSKEGDDVAGFYGVTRWEPKESHQGEAESPPPGIIPVYDVEAMERFLYLFVPGEEVIATEKIHGCLPARGRIVMYDGTRKPITKVKVGDLVLGVASEGKVVPSRVTRKYDNGKAGLWLKITGTRKKIGRGNSYFSLHCTPEHKLFDPISNGYREASTFKVNDKVQILRSEYALPFLQKQILLGKLLGDGYLSIYKKSASVTWSHKKEDILYHNWTQKALGVLDSGTSEELVSGFGSLMVRGRSIGTYEIKEYFKSFYKTGTKIVPAWVANELGPISLAFWFMDDGSLGHHEDQEDRAHFAVCGFTEKDCKILLKGLKRLGIKAEYYKAKGYPRLRLNSEEAEKLFLLVAPYIPKVMQRKLPERYRGHEGWIPSEEQQFKSTVISQSITKIEEDATVKSLRYDIETETHNYFANGVLVHNSNARFTFKEGRMWCGSRNQWKRNMKGVIWWRALQQNPWLENFCRAYPGIVVYGEVYGWVQTLHYGLKEGMFGVAVFDVFDEGKWWDSDTFSWQVGNGNIQAVPVLYRGLFDFERMKELAQGPSLLGGGSHYREGIVVKPIKERTAIEIGRVQLKLVSPEYYEKEGKEK